MAELKESFVPQVLVDYYQNKRTGILTLKQATVRKTIHFENGDVVFATSSLDSEQLGVFLVEWGLLTQEQLNNVNKLAQENRRFGKSLLELHYFQPEDLVKLFYKQIVKIIASTFDWEAFECRFTRCALPEYEVKNLISVPQILLEGFRNIGDLLLLKQMFEDFYTPLKLTLSLTDIYKSISLTSQEAFLLSNIENSTFRVDELVKIGSLSEDVVVKTISALWLSGYLAPSREPITEYKPMLETSDLPLHGIDPQPVQEIPAITAKPSVSEASHSSQTPFLGNTGARISLPQVNPLSPSSTYSGRVVNSPPAKPSSAQALLDTHSAMEFCREIENKISAINSMGSLYEVLEVSSSASKEQIKAAYERLNKLFNPSRQQELTPYKLNLSNELNYISTTIKQAYEILINQFPTEPTATNTTPSVGFSNKVTASNNPVVQPEQSASTVKNLSQQEAMEFCYLIETKLNLVKSENTHYQILELERSATKEMIDKAYTDLIEQFNLKKQEMLSQYGINMSSQLNEINRAITLAAEVLSNPQKKQIYDEQLKGGKRNTGQYSASQTELKNALGKSPDNKYLTPSSRPSLSPSNPALARPTVPTNPALVRPTVPSTPPSQVLPVTNPNRSTPGARIPSSPSTPITSTNPALPTPNAAINQANNNMLRSNSGAIPNSNAPDLTRSSAGNKPSIIIDPSRAALPTLTPLIASRAQANPIQPAQPAQPAQPSKPITVNELPQTNKNIPGGKGKTFTATEYYLKSIELCDQKKYVEAVEMLMFALKISPKDGEYWAQLARAYNNISGYEQDAEAAYKKAIECAPRDLNYFFELGNLYRHQSLNDKAVEMYQEVLKINPNSNRAKTAITEIAKEEEEAAKAESSKPKSFWSKLLRQE